ncbi:MAG TPA: hypothetical protein VL967_02025 [Terracidiphilus sp.]|nr:hypothetical protein [Terracidiphilus sp.]
MNIGCTVKFTLAAASLALLSPGFARASNSTDANAAGARAEAMQMVPARAAVIKKLDANKLKPGEQFKVQLADTVHLKDGTELHRGTMLYGVISTDNLHPGNSKLALNFTKAEPKDGEAIPIKATIVGVVGPESQNMNGYEVARGDQQPNEWNASTLRIDEIGALSGVDLHSRIDGNNSGVFVTTKKDDVKLSPGSELMLAIAAQKS